MKRIHVAVIGLCALTVMIAWPALRAQGSGVINFQNLGVDQVLEMYKGLTQTELVVASNVKLAAGKITARSGNDLKKEEAARLLEERLLQQAGVIVTRLDAKRVSVTYNDRLVLPVKLSR